MMGETGYGGGLILVKHLVDDLHGQIEARSNPGEATFFEVVINGV